MERKPITSFWLILTAAACWALPAVQGQEQPDLPAPNEKKIVSTGHAAPGALHNWLPALTAEQSKQEYNLGLKALRTRHWAKAALHFELALQSNESPREALKRLEQARKGLDRLDPAHQLESFYSEGEAAMASGDWRLAILAFQKVDAHTPEYRETAQLLPSAAQKLRQQLIAAHLPAVSELLLDSLRTEAAQAIAQTAWLPAIVALEKIRVLRPNDANVDTLLTVVYERLNNDHASSPGTEAPYGINAKVAQTAAALLLLPLFGYLLVSPTVRARVHFMRGNFTQALRLYEKLVARNPKHVKYYGMLAQTCLKLERRDEFACKIYHIVLQLNLLNPTLREKINGIVAQYYLAEGRQDRDAIEVLEEALAYELHKQPNNGMALIKAGANGLTKKSSF